MITLTALVVPARSEELAMHLRAALRNGLSADQIGEVLLHAAVYAGVPAANRAFRSPGRAGRRDGVTRRAACTPGSDTTAIRRRVTTVAGESRPVVIMVSV